MTDGIGEWYEAKRAAAKRHAKNHDDLAQRYAHYRDVWRMLVGPHPRAAEIVNAACHELIAQMDREHRALERARYVGD